MECIICKEVGTPEKLFSFHVEGQCEAKACAPCAVYYASQHLMNSYPIGVKDPGLAMYTMRIECPACRQEVALTSMKSASNTLAAFNTTFDWKDLMYILNPWGDKICKDLGVKRNYQKQVHDLSREVTRYGMYNKKLKACMKHRRVQERLYRIAEDAVDIEYGPETEAERQANNDRIPLTIRQPIN